MPLVFPPPSERQARILWFSLTALAVGIFVLLLGLVFWGLGFVINQLSGVLLPMAIAGIIACLLSPLVDFLERKKIRRHIAILLVFVFAALIVLLIGATVIPRLLSEAEGLVRKLPEIVEAAPERIAELLKKTPFQSTVLPTAAQPGDTAAEEIPLWETEAGVQVMGWVKKALPEVSQWAFAQLKRLASLFGLVAGLALIPVYVFYFLLEKKQIETNWTAYLPVRESWAKEELVFVLRAINERLVTFFRGQVLVAMCVGTLLTIAFLILGLNYAVLLGVIAGLFGIIPYLGVLLSLVPALLIAIVQFNDPWHPLAVLGIFAVVQALEGFVISPKIIGDRVGLHPLTIIIAVMVGTTLMGGILGGVLAIPLTAVLRELMFRYIWKKRQAGTVGR